MFQSSFTLLPLSAPFLYSAVCSELPVLAGCPAIPQCIVVQNWNFPTGDAGTLKRREKLRK